MRYLFFLAAVAGTIPKWVENSHRKSNRFQQIIAHKAVAGTTPQTVGNTTVAKKRFTNDLMKSAEAEYRKHEETDDKLRLAVPGPLHPSSPGEPAALSSSCEEKKAPHPHPRARRSHRCIAEVLLEKGRLLILPLQQRGESHFFCKSWRRDLVSGPNGQSPRRSPPRTRRRLLCVHAAEVLDLPRLISDLRVPPTRSYSSESSPKADLAPERTRFMKS